MTIEHIKSEEAQAQADLTRAQTIYAARSLELRVELGIIINAKREGMKLSRDRAASLLGMPAGRSSFFIAEDPLVAKQSYSVARLLGIIDGLDKLEPILSSLPLPLLGKRGPEVKDMQQ